MELCIHNSIDKIFEMGIAFIIKIAYIGEHTFELKSPKEIVLERLVKSSRHNRIRIKPALPIFIANLF